MKYLIVLLFFPVCAFGQSFKSALDKQDYNEVIKILKDSLSHNPNNPQIYCDLGHYYHYRAYDWRPLIGYNENYSDSIIQYLEKAISINPNFRNAYYWLHAEYGTRAALSFVNRKIDKCKVELKTAKIKGAMPDWLLEFGRNTLCSCDSNAILFTSGDLSFNAISYLQLIDNYRTDVTVIPVWLSGRPNFAKLFKNGIDKIIKPVKIRFSDEQIMEMRPFQWDTIDVKIKIPLKTKQKYKIEKDYFNWSLIPDMSSEGTLYLSPWRALFAEIIEANQFERPIYFAEGFREKDMAGLIPYTINCGLVKMLVPFKTKGTAFEINPTVIENVLLNKDNFKDFKDVESHNFPNNSQILLSYHLNYWHLSIYYKKNGMNDKISQLRDFMKLNVTSGILETDTYLNWIK